jgi:hypothetical protein
MNATQFAWAYLLKHGNVGVKVSYYSGFDPIDPKKYRQEYGTAYDAFIKAKEIAIKEIRQFGINWKKTVAPRSDFEDQFNGTFNDPKTKEYLSGKIFLKNGHVQEWLCESVQVTNVFVMMAEVQGIVEEYKDLLKE